MAAPAKQNSRWGSFLQQAVAGVESRLDTILAEGGDDVSKPAKAIPTPSNAGPAKVEGVLGISRSSSNSKTNDRLQERLARAVAAKNAQKAAAGSPSSNVPSRTGSPLTASGSPRQSLDAISTEGQRNGEQIGSPDAENAEPLSQGDSPSTPSVSIRPSTPAADTPSDMHDSPGAFASRTAESPRRSMDSTKSSIFRNSIDSIRPQDIPHSSTECSTTEPDPGLLQFKTPAEYEALLSQLQSDYQTSELQRQEEVHGYIERIDALQAKLQYLAKETAEAARKAAGAAPAGSQDKKLAEKEEQVALLMEEGQKLSKKELSHLTTIKKLRAKIAEDSKEVAEAKTKQEKAERDAMILLDRVKRGEGAEKRLNEKTRLANQLQKEIDALKIDRDSKDATIANLKAELEEAIAQEKQAETKLVHEALEVEKKRVADLEEDLDNLKIEKNLATDRAQAQIRELREKMDREAETARIASLEMKAEQQMLESKLELMRARAEEVSSGATGDAQAKLLRQIETLQTQYAVASENWQGIEASLNARATTLEKERDEATKREADIRRKAREVTLKAKKNEDELEETRSKLPNFQQELNEHKAQLGNLQRRAEEAEAALIEAKYIFEQERQAWKSELSQRIEDEKQKMVEDTFHRGGSSPAASTRRGLTTEYLGLQNLQIRRASTRGSTVGEPTPSTDRILGRRQSAQPFTRSSVSGHGTPTRQDSSFSLAMTNGSATDALSIHTTDQDDFFENHRSSSPQQTIQDMVSTSTAAAGPSVQLVERMSSAVRRLESEKVATKEDLARLSAQRDEARAEIISLMREIEAKREADARVAELEKEVKDLNSRYLTTLEMLGEKSEEVDELRSDIKDIKAMYRELVEETIKMER